MMTTYNALDLEWHPLRLELDGFASPVAKGRAIERRLERILGEWKDTPYHPSFIHKKQGVYCTAFVCRVLEELYRREWRDMLNIPDDISFHNREGAIAGLKWFMRQFPACEKITDNKIEPGDVIITGPEGGGPGHAIIVGPRRNTMWQASGTCGVHFTGLALPNIYELYAAYRFSDRSTWA